eukprot:gnl/TRDRNA2_/TRDRNA2_75409_c0_seq1.p1 gnl/TRDRNA2_/TRDRNA2_75409_c0~~gnl/TRDRNA2_/TRDRNA2_75409_c0_seq1.p1  ORF type:complete len:151 (+),score=21.52 gnl/TRDRNA2_/TRDRNA2_75409_c0_seq1:215-667(+)
MDLVLFSALASATKQHRSWGYNNWKAQELTNTAWAFSTSGEPLHLVLDPVAMLKAVEAHGVKAEVRHYQMSVECLSMAGQIVAGFDLLMRAVVSGLVSSSDDTCYAMFRTLLEACRATSDSDGTSRTQAAMKHLGLVAPSPVATAIEAQL